MKRTIKIGSLILLAVGLVLLYQYRHYIPWNYNAKPAADQPLLRIPFPAGTVVMCNQGNKSPAGRTHSSGNCLHALDFSLVPYDSDIVAAATGTVRYVLDQVKPVEAVPAPQGDPVTRERRPVLRRVRAGRDTVQAWHNAGLPERRLLERAMVA